MSATTLAGLLLIAVPVAFNLAFGLLAARFDYPDVLRKPTRRGAGRVPRRRHAAGAAVVGLRAHGAADGATRRAALACDRGCRLRRCCPSQRRWACSPRSSSSSASSAGRSSCRTSHARRLSPARARRGREAVDVVFQSFNRYLGVAVGEHLGYGLTGAWTTLAGICLTQTSAVPGWLGVIGIVIGPILMLCSLEFVGQPRAGGWKVAERITPAAYVAWSLWLIATGIALIA